MRQSHDLRATVARRSWERREAVDGNKCSQFHLANIGRVSRECRTNIAQMSWNIRQWFVRQSHDIRATVANMSYSPIRCDRNVIMVAMSYFCRQNVSQIRLEIVVNCSHPSEILALRAISVNSYAHNFCVGKQEKLSRSCLPDHLRIRINTVFRYTYVSWIFPHFLTKEGN